MTFALFSGLDGVTTAHDATLLLDDATFALLPKDVWGAPVYRNASGEVWPRCPRDVYAWRSTAEFDR